MPKLSLDEFAASLQHSVGKAQEAIAQRNRGRLERQIQLTRDGRTETVTWSFVMDTDGEKPSETVRLPLVCMRSLLQAQVVELKLELNTAIQEAPRSTEGKAPRRLQLVVKRSWRSARQRLHQLSFRLVGKQPGKIEVTLDGNVIKAFDAAKGETETEDSPAPQTSSGRQ